MFDIVFDKVAQLFGIAKWRQCPVHEANDLGQVNFRRRTTESIAAFGAADTFQHAGVFQFEQDEFKKLLRQTFVIRDVADANRAFVITPGKPHHGLQSVESFLRNFHAAHSFAVEHIINVDGHTRLYLSKDENLDRDCPVSISGISPGYGEQRTSLMRDGVDDSTRMPYRGARIGPVLVGRIQIQIGRHKRPFRKLAGTAFRAVGVCQGRS